MGEYDQQRRRWPFEDGGGLSRAGGQLPREAYKLDLPSWYTGASRTWNTVKFRIGLFEEESFFCRPIAAQVTHKIDVKEGKGKDGATLNHQGISPSRVNITLGIWTGKDEGRWNRFYPKINPKQNPQGRVVVGIENPTLARAGITSVYVYDIKELLGDGVLEVQLQCIEWLAPKKVTTAKQKKPGAMARANALDEGANSNDVRTAVTDPAKDVKIK